MAGENAGGEQINYSDLPNLIHEVRLGKVSVGETSVHIGLEQNDGLEYCDAQVDDYHEDRVLDWRPPVRMYLRARFSHPQDEFIGTAGFGFWNDPFGTTRIGEARERTPWARFPQAVWFFFASPPSNMALAMNVAGMGWKAATIDAGSLAAKLLLPLAPFGMLACRWPPAYRMVWPLAQRMLKIDETILTTSMEDWHDYSLVWKEDSVDFAVDGIHLFTAQYSPSGPLGFVAWVDNQFMVATPQGVVRNGTLETDEEWLEIAALEVERIS